MVDKDFHYLVSLKPKERGKKTVHPVKDRNFPESIGLQCPESAPGI
jgi:hypothetical protein